MSSGNGNDMASERTPFTGVVGDSSHARMHSTMHHLFVCFCLYSCGNLKDSNGKGSGGTSLNQKGKERWRSQVQMLHKWPSMWIDSGGSGRECTSVRRENFGNAERDYLFNEPNRLCKCAHIGSACGEHRLLVSTKSTGKWLAGWQEDCHAALHFNHSDHRPSPRGNHHHQHHHYYRTEAV